MPRVLIAPTAFKGTLSPSQVANAIADGLRGCDEVECTLLPLADGGDGTIEAVHVAAGGVLREEQVLGPTGRPVKGVWLQLEDQALIELASACGIATLAGELDAMAAHTYGLGQMIRRAWERGMRKINIAVGGSASTDGGMGALRALGATFFDDSGNEIENMGGGTLCAITDCDLTETRWLTRNTRLTVLTDVKNPLLGPLGAAAIFAPQKGASGAQVDTLERGLAHYAEVLERTSDESVRTANGAGAAGGTAFGLAAALGADIASGFDWIANATKLDQHIKQCDFVITGEGRFDTQSLHGKVIGELLGRCREYGRPVFIVAGCADEKTMVEGVEDVLVPSPSQHGHCTADDIARTVGESLCARLLVQE